MTWLAVIWNIGIVFILLYLLADDGLPREAEGWLLVFVIAATPLVNLIALSRAHRSEGESGWLSLLLQRKALEEKMRIEKLRKSE